MKRGIRMLSFLLAAILLCSLLAGCADTARPLNYVKDALENTLYNRFGGFYTDILKQALAGGSVEVKYGGTDLLESPLDAGELKVYFDRDGKRLTALGFATVEGSKYDGQIYFTENELAVASDAFLGANRFGMKFDHKLKEQISGSVFHNSTGDSNPLKKDWVNDSLADTIITVKDDIFRLYTSMEQMLSVSDEITELFLDALASEAPNRIDVTNGKAHVTATVTNVTFSRALKATRAAVVSNGRLCNELRRYAALRDSLTTVQTGVESKEMQNRINNFINEPNSINEICDTVDNEIVDFEISLDVTVDYFSNMIDQGSVAVKLKEKGEAEWVELCALEADLTDAAVSDLTFRLLGSEVAFTYRVCKNGLQHYGAELTLAVKNALGEQTVDMKGKIEADRYANSFTLTLDQEGDHRVYSGGFDKRPYSFWFSVDGVTVNGEQHALSISLAVEANADAGKMIEYDPLFTVEQNRFLAVDNRMKEKASALAAAWGDKPLDWTLPVEFLLTVTGLSDE